MEKNKKKYNIAEKTSFFFGCIVILSLLSYLIYKVVTEKRSNPPQLVVTTMYDPKMSYNAYEVWIENIGDETAEEVNLSLSLYQDGKEVETATMTVLYVPIQSKETGWAVFHSARKSNDSLVVSSISYIEP